MHTTYNDQSRWASAGIYKRPDFDVEAYQRRINRIVGVSPSGAPIVRLIWAWDARRWENTEWDGMGQALAGEWRQRYRALTVELGGGDYVDISPPRWILEERYEPESIATSWERTRYRRVITGETPVICKSCKQFGRWVLLDRVPTAWLDVKRCKDDQMWIDWWHPDWSEGHLLCCRFCQEYTELATVNNDVWGEVPREGWYNMLPHVGIIAHHANGCCQPDAPCYGMYKLPDNWELRRLKKAINLRNKDTATNPHVAPELNTVALMQAKRWGLQMMAAEKGRKHDELVSSLTH